ncbi:MAG: hypothetical protein COA42_01165 [Alteromonadaceae bacterium]|nr:MAG: hypothetical protein COA42_01165 [Alteromonadaceae bacterium]
MQWPSVKYKKFAKYAGVAALALNVCAAYGLDDKRLWLPAKYNTYFLKLKDAALAAEALDRCVKVLSGTIDLEQGVPDHPMYRILCQQKSGRNYNEMVDGLTMETLTTQIIIELEPTPEELEIIRIAEEARIAMAREVRMAEQWQICNDALMSKVTLMAGVSVLTLVRPEPVEFTEELVSYLIDFDAKDMYGAALKYRSSCTSLVSGEVSVGIRRRVD